MFFCFYFLLGVSLLLKHRFGGKLLSTCSSSNSICSCHRSFHLFCTDLLVSEPSSTMINIHPAPRHHDRNARRLLLSSARKRKSRLKEEADQEAIMTSTRSDPCQLTIADSQSLEKKVKNSHSKNKHRVLIKISNLNEAKFFSFFSSYRFHFE